MADEDEDFAYKANKSEVRWNIARIVPNLLFVHKSERGKTARKPF